MPYPGSAPGRGQRPPWPLLAAWAVSVTSLLAVVLLPRPTAHAYGMVLLGCSAGSLMVVLAYARLLRRRATPPRTLLLVGGPWQGQILLTGADVMPEAVWLASAGAPVCSSAAACMNATAAVASAALRAGQQHRAAFLLLIKPIHFGTH